MFNLKTLKCFSKKIHFTQFDKHFVTETHNGRAAESKV